MPANYRLPISTSQLNLIRNMMQFSPVRHPMIVQRQHILRTYEPLSYEPMVPRGRVELPLSCENRILSPNALPYLTETIGLYRVQSATYTIRLSDARSDGDPCRPIVTVQSTGQLDT